MVHAYFDVDLDIVWQVITKYLPLLLIILIKLLKINILDKNNN